MARSRSRRRPHGWRRVTETLRSRRVQVGLGVLVLLVIAGGIFVSEALKATGALKDARDEAAVLKEQIVSGDVNGARATLERLDRETTRAHDASDGPLWSIGAHVPIVGKNVDAVRTVAREIDRITDDALPSIVDVADQVQLETFRPKNGRVDVAALAAIRPVLERSNRVFEEAEREIGSFDPGSLIGPLQSPMRSTQNLVTVSASAAGAADDAARLLPTMLATDGKKRTYLLMVLNNAEVRAIGGMPGSVAVLTAKNGKVTMGEQAGTRKVGFVKNGAKLTKEERNLLGSSLTKDMRDTGAHPDFPRAAELTSQIVGKRLDRKFSGAIAVDPVALALLLGGIGPVDLADGTRLTSSNAAQVLLNGVYAKYPLQAQKQDDVFEQAARAIFTAVTSGRGNSQAVVKALVRSVRAGHIKVWSKVPAEQKLILDGGISGALNRHPGKTPYIGVYVDDGGSTKMEYFLQMKTTVQATRCFDDRGQEFRVTTQLSSLAPPNATRFTRSIVGPGLYVKPGSMRLVVSTMGPTKGFMVEQRVDGRQVPLSGGELYDRRVVRGTVVIAPGESVVIVTTMRSAPGVDGDPVLQTTPGIRPNGDEASKSACS
ncbi:DUF4012 domain-containing protein [Aeromicrobium terrae]|uniref:DUF4012 domain-containing protein n=1 Tax=Aeromicrobium terrae TaxID=2498846 RepID=A0A5C8NMG7_9ACTN|nr:DUF4012 domain-containing protein [Aeromicrobium terrae]